MEGKCGSLSSSIFINYYKLSKTNKEEKKFLERLDKRREETNSTPVPAATAFSNKAEHSK